MARERGRHPSGRPIRRHIVKDPIGYRRPPPDEPLTPGLRSDRSVEAIGFHHFARAPDDADDAPDDLK